MNTRDVFGRTREKHVDTRIVDLYLPTFNNTYTLRVGNAILETFKNTQKTKFSVSKIGYIL